MGAYTQPFVYQIGAQRVPPRDLRYRYLWANVCAQIDTFSSSDQNRFF
jgi:hypothetical protein